MKNGLIIDENGTQRYYMNNMLHREGGPAIVCANGNEWWYRNNKEHRIDGPAIVWADGDEYWLLDGVNMTEEEHAAAVKEL